MAAAACAAASSAAAASVAAARLRMSPFCCGAVLSAAAMPSGAARTRLRGRAERRPNPAPPAPRRSLQHSQVAPASRSQLRAIEYENSGSSIEDEEKCGSWEKSVFLRGGPGVDSPTVLYLSIPCCIWIQQIRRQLLERRACTGTWKPLRPRDVHPPDTRPQSRISRAVMPPMVSARSLAEANIFSRMRPRAAVGQCDRTVGMPAPCPSRVRAVHTTIARFGPPPKFPTFLH